MFCTIYKFLFNLSVAFKSKSRGEKEVGGTRAPHMAHDTTTPKGKRAKETAEFQEEWLPS